jgi:hypothetical protein
MVGVVDSFLFPGTVQHPFHLAVATTNINTEI